MKKYRNPILFIILTILLTAVFILSLSVGAVKVEFAEVIGVLIGLDNVSETSSIIVLESRLPMAVGAILTGAALSVSGLMMQTLFQNPLAGPGVLGITSGASLGVALAMLGAGGVFGAFMSSSLIMYTTIVGGLLGALATIAVLVIFNYVLRNAAVLLIVGIMVSYLTSSVVSLLNFFAPSEGVKSFVVWGLGSFMGLTRSDLPLMCILVIGMSIWAWCMTKPLNALLLGERYTQNMGYEMQRLRFNILSVVGILTGIVTAYCGPIGFIGLIVAHICRIMFATSNHRILLPATILTGAIITLLCAIVATLPSSMGVLPVNAITPVIGVPIILYLIINRRRLRYFS